MEWIRVISEGVGSVIFKKMPLNLSRCYRVFTSSTTKRKVGSRKDVLATSYQMSLDWKRYAKVIEIPCFRVFYEGSEEELGRYLDWLIQVHLVQDDGAPPPVYVAVQDSCLAQQDLESLYPNIDTYFIGPGEMEHYGLLTGEPSSPASIGIF